jgi:hypothetical protein
LRSIRFSFNGGTNFKEFETSFFFDVGVTCGRPIFVAENYKRLKRSKGLRMKEKSVQL